MILVFSRKAKENPDRMTGVKLFEHIKQLRNNLLSNIEWLLKLPNQEYNKNCDFIIYFDNGKESLPVKSFDGYCQETLYYTEIDGAERYVHIGKITEITKWIKGAKVIDKK